MVIFPVTLSDPTPNHPISTFSIAFNNICNIILSLVSKFIIIIIYYYFLFVVVIRKDLHTILLTVEVLSLHDRRNSWLC